MILRHMLLSSNLRGRRGGLGHARLRRHRPLLTAAARHGIDIIHVDHVPTSRPRGCRGRLLLLQRHGGRHRLSTARAPRHRRLRPHRLLLLVLLRRLGHTLARRRRPLTLRRGLLLPGFHMGILGFHADVHCELLQTLLQRRNVLVRLKGRGRPVERFLEALGHLRELIQPLWGSVRLSLLQKLHTASLGGDREEKWDEGAKGQIYKFKLATNVLTKQKTNSSNTQYLCAIRANSIHSTPSLANYSHLGNHLPPLVDVLVALPSPVETLLDGIVVPLALLRRPLLVLPLLRRLLQRRALTRRPTLRRIHRSRIFCCICCFSMGLVCIKRT